jgi:hypothetical protein
VKAVAEEKPMGLGKIGAAIAAPESEPEMGEEEASAEEVLAFKAFKGASSPEAGAVALKNFIKMCGGY